MIFQEYHEAIAAHLKTHTPLQNILFYPSGRSLLEVPVGFLEMSGLAMGTPSGTEGLALHLDWSLSVLVEASLKNAPVVLRSLAAEIGAALYLEKFHPSLGPVLELEFEFEAPQEAEAFLIATLHWKQEAHVGTSVWDPEDFIPPTHVEVHFKQGDVYVV